MSRASRIASAVAWAELRGRERGLKGPSSTWLAVWVAASGYRWIKRMTAPEPVVVREVLHPGQRLVVTHYAEDQEPPPLSQLSPRARKRAARAAARSATRSRRRR